MLYIKKGPEPRSLTEYKVLPDATYEGFRDKPAIHDALLAEQGHICAYCMCRIYSDTIKIEHWNAQHAIDGSGMSTALDYRNMLGVCPGNKGAPYRDETCDAHRKNKPLYINPQDPNMIARIRYQSNGIIYSDDERINDDLNSVLNLNCERSYLVENRKRAIQTLQQYLRQQQPSGTWSMALLRKTKEHFLHKNEGKHLPFLGAILYFIDHYIQKAH